MNRDTCNAQMGAIQLSGLHFSNYGQFIFLAMCCFALPRDVTMTTDLSCAAHERKLAFDLSVHSASFSDTRD